jgi:hypothetical protein
MKNFEPELVNAELLELEESLRSPNIRFHLSFYKCI